MSASGQRRAYNRPRFLFFKVLFFIELLLDLAKLSAVIGLVAKVRKNRVSEREQK